MLSEKTIKELISTPAFLSHCNKLAYELGISRLDASQELLLELLDHRLRKWSDKDVTMAIAKDLPSLRWKIKYAAKDYYRRVNKDANRELEKAQMVAHMTRAQPSNPDEVLEALERLPELFKNANTRNWCESILRVGQKETMVRFHQTPRQFNSKLAKVCKYCHQHRQPKQPNSHTKERELLKQWDGLMVDPHTSDDDVQTFINGHQDYISQVVDNPLIKFQGKVLKDFVNSGKDKYTFNELMHTKYIKLEQELDRRKI
ncbi:hypothetical protein Lpp125_04946 [Lacticaseibacillus paracasei subsp. paracasei Lpp125]|uniref:hypothetical protein n=1 Tax=Lacticaseibacillus paracasei TaxID=1597 RepID=UPI0003437A1E|nr:hypothetical protein [Lacticaseibacillus paracasei]EPD01576.1 hypothetical protein Lpp125_04946 [Lacticaseibacillus paracasei subsp. paracasei Lpp125]